MTDRPARRRAYSGLLCDVRQLVAESLSTRGRAGIVNAITEEGQLTQQVSVQSSSTVLTLTIDGTNFKRIGHKNKFGKEYNPEQYEKY